MSALPSPDRLEIIGPDGQVTFYALDPAQGLTNVGSHPDNDIVLEGPGIAPFHAVIDHRQKPYQLLRLGIDRPTEPPTSLNNWDAITLEDYTLIYLEGDKTPEEPPSAEPAGAGLELPATPASLSESSEIAEARPQALAPMEPAAALKLLLTAPIAPPRSLEPDLETPVPSKALPLALTLAASPQSLAVDPGQTATFQVTVSNPTPEPVDFTVKVTGTAAPWVNLPLTGGRLANGQRAVETATIRPARRVATTAGEYEIVVEVSSPDLPEPCEPARITLTIKPYGELAVTEIAPRPQDIFWSQASTRMQMAVTNSGNAEACFDISGEDEQRLCQIELQTAEHAPWQPKRAEVSLSPGQTLPIVIRLTPLTRLFAALGPRLHFFTITVAPQAGEHGQRIVLGQVRQHPLLGRAALFLVTLICLGLLPLLFRPAVYEFSATPAHIIGGQTATLRWSVAPFSTLRIAPEVGWATGLNGQQTIAPRYDTVYTLTAENSLAWLNPGLFRATRTTLVLVDPVLPRVRLTADQKTVPAGGAVTLSWQVLNVSDLVLMQNGVPEIIPPEQYSSGQRIKTIAANTTFVLVARNEYTPPEGITAAVTVMTDQVPGMEATPTAALPVIEKFDVSPAEIYAGEPVRLEWAVSGVDSVTISPEPGASAPSGAVVLRPQQTTTYNLSASKNGVPLQLSRQVVVKAAPPTNLAPQAPVITSFTATPAQVSPDSSEAQHIQLTWAVSGDVTRVEISRPGLPIVAGLAAQGTLEVAVTATSTFTLAAYNGDAVTTQSVTVQVSASLPTLTSLSPASIPAGASAFTLAVNGSGFVRTSVVWWNGAPRATTYVSSGLLTTAITAADVAQAANVNVTVVSPAPGGGTSAPLPFTVVNPPPVISSLSPASALAGGAAFALDIHGTGFNGQSQVAWNGMARVVSIFSATKLTVLIPAEDIAAAGTAQVTVLNASPGGGIAAAAFVVAAPPSTQTPTPTATSTPTETPTPTPTPTATSTTPAGGQDITPSP